MNSQDTIIHIFQYLQYNERYIVSNVSKKHRRVFRHIFIHPEIFKIKTRSFLEIESILSDWKNHKFSINLSFDDDITDIDINFLGEYNNIDTIDIRHCGSITDISKFQHVKEICISGAFNPEFRKYSNINISVDSLEAWKNISPQNTTLIDKCRKVLYSPQTDKSKIPRGGWCHPLCTINFNLNEQQLLYQIGVYYDKIKEKILDISIYIIDDDTFKYLLSTASFVYPEYDDKMRKNKLIMYLCDKLLQHFNNGGPTNKYIGIIFDLSKSDEEIKRHLYKVFFIKNLIF